MAQTASSVDHLCYNCFSRLDGLDGPCPYCGFDLAENEKKYPVALRAGTVLNNRYIIGRVLGQGGFGITYLALDTKLSARVAIKEFMPGEIATRMGTTVSVMSQEKATDFSYGAERFREEARTLAKFIGHPNIAGVSDCFDENGTSYFVMDYIEGVSFKSYIANAGGKVTVDEALNVMIPVLRALTAVHQEGFIHRDVTPDNIYISKDGNVKLLDFGSARYSIGDKSKSLDVILKVGYAPKEQYIRRGRQGPFTDVYSCAACFYAALTGYLPPESLERLDQDTLTPVSQAGVEVPEWLDKAILKGLAVQPEDRFQSAAEFLDAIENQQVVELSAPGPAPAQPEKKRLKPAMIGGIAAAVLALVIGVGVLGGGGSGDEGGGIVEALAPKVTIAGQEISTADTILELENITLTEADCEAVQKMTNLEEVYLDNVVLKDFGFLTDLPNLHTLTVGISSFDSLDGLESLTQLRTLDIYDTNYEMPRLYLSDLTKLSGLTRLETLRFGVYGLDSFSGIETLTNLQEANFQNGGDATYDNVDPLAGLTNLKVLWLPMHAYITGSGEAQKGVPFDITGLAGLTNLTDLTMEYFVKDLEPLRNLTNLKNLSVKNGSGVGVQIFDSLEPLSGLTQLTSLSLRMNDSVPTFNGTTDLSALAGLTNLQALTITGWHLNDLSPLRNLTQLQSLSLDRTGNPEYVDLSPLEGLTELRVFSINNTLPDLDQTGVAHVPNVKIS